MPTPAALKSDRLTGLDVARYLAFVGMVIVNFRTVMVPAEGSGLLHALVGALEGRAAATFVVLAGVGLGMAATRAGIDTVSVTLRRAAFLMVLGLANLLVFDADILHYYAVYFLFGALLLSVRSRNLIALIVGLNAAFVAMLFVLDYEAGWNWTDLSYSDLWTVEGFLRHLFFNGWHPVVPWLGFLLFGIVLSRLKLQRRSTQWVLMIGGLIAICLAEGVSALLTPWAAAIDPELVSLVGTEPLPPLPLYGLAGMGVAAFVIGLCLAASPFWVRSGLNAALVPAGRQTLTLYVAHIFIGMGVLEELGMLQGQSLETALAAALIFCAGATVYAALWSRWIKRGPIESVMRRVAG